MVPTWGLWNPREPMKNMEDCIPSPHFNIICLQITKTPNPVSQSFHVLSGTLPY